MGLMATQVHRGLHGKAEPRSSPMMGQVQLCVAPAPQLASPSAMISCASVAAGKPAPWHEGQVKSASAKSRTAAELPGPAGCALGCLPLFIRYTFLKMPCSSLLICAPHLVMR